MVLNIANALSAYRQGSGAASNVGGAGAGESGGGNFVDTLKGFMGDTVNALQEGDKAGLNAATGKGVSSVDALKTAGLLMLTFKLSTAAAQTVFGFVADRVERSRLLVASLLLTGLTLVSTALVGDVFSVGMYVVVGAIGVAESALIVCGQSMLGEEAPPDLRGSAMGIFYFCGTLGVVMMSSIAGLLFDKIGYAAPFVMVGLLNLVFAGLGAVMVLRRQAESAPAEDAAHRAPAH